MFARLTALLLAASLLLQIGSQAIVLGWFVLDNQAFTERFCQRWEEEAPMCFGSCKIAEAFVATAPVTDQFSREKPTLRKVPFCLLAEEARPQDTRTVVKQGKKRQPVYYVPLYARTYVEYVFWPPALGAIVFRDRSSSQLAYAAK